jgi:hypothetical protein
MRSRARIATVIGLVMAALASTASPAFALSRRTVCAQDVWVRPCPACGPAIAILYRGEHFDYERSAYHNGYQWAYGFALGGENVWGWLPYETITNSSGQCQ